MQARQHMERCGFRMHALCLTCKKQTLRSILSLPLISKLPNEYMRVPALSLQRAPETIGPRMMALPWPAQPKETSLTPSNSVGVIDRVTGSICSTRTSGLTWPWHTASGVHGQHA